MRRKEEVGGGACCGLLLLLFDSELLEMADYDTCEIMIDDSAP